MKKLLSDPKKKVKIMDTIREGHFHAYGYRKGAATHATAATMEPPPIPSVMLRGSWSFGGSLDVYWFFSHVSDAYLGRLLAGFDADGIDIAMLPPHFKEGSENKFIKEAMELTFGGILKKHPETRPCLLLFLASIVYHQSFLRKYFRKNSKHPFNDIAILHKQDLLKELTALVTLEPCNEVKKATGVPRYNKLLKMVEEIVKGNVRVLDLIAKEVATIPKVVGDSINAIASKAGNVTVPMVMTQIEKVAESIEDVVRTQVTAALKEYQQVVPVSAAAVSTATAPSLNLNGGNAGTLNRTYPYIDPDRTGKNAGKSQSFLIPHDFDFPTPCLRNGWFYWYNGLPDNVSKKEDGSGNCSAPVPPFKHMSPNMLPWKKRRHYNDCWVPIMEYLEDAAKSDESFDSSAPITDSYDVAMRVLEEQHPSLFSKRGHGSWKVATWSKELRKSRRKRKAADMV